MTPGEFMVSWVWNGPDSQEIDALIVKERALLEEWRREGVLAGRWIAMDECSGWLLPRADDEAAVWARLETLPLRQWLKMTVTPLG